MPAITADLRRRFLVAAVVAGLLSAGVGLIVLVAGWWLDASSIRQPLVDYPAMRAATAVGLVLVGAGIAVKGTHPAWGWLPGVAGSGALAIGLVTGAAYVAGLPKTSLESAVALDVARDLAVEGRVAVNTSMCFVLAGVGLLLLAVRRAPGLRQGLGVAVFLIAYSAVLGYASATVEVAGGLQPGFTAMAPHTAVPMLMLGFGVVFVDLDRGWGRIFIEPLAGGRVLRAGMPVLLLLFAAASVLYAVLDDGLGGGRSGGGIVLALVAIAVIAGMIVLATRLERIDSERMDLATDLEGRLAAQRLDARQASSLMRAQFDAAPNGIAILGTDGRILDVNPVTTRLLGRTRDEVVGCRLDDLVVAEDADLLRRSSSAALAPTEPRLPVDVRMGGAAGETLSIRTSFGVMRDEGGAPLLLVASLVDVTERLAAERRLRDNEELLRVVLDGSADLVIRIGPDMRIEYVNQRVVDVTGLPVEHWLGRTFSEAGYSREDADAWDVRHRRVFETGEPDAYEFEIDNLEGHRWYESRAAPVRGPDGSVSHVVVTSRDVTKRKRAEADLVLLATHDPLTQLANRAELGEELARALSSGRRSGHATGALMIDLDHFKYVNDSLGHGVGDDLLKLVSQRLSATVRGGDLVGRLGGDEFLIVMRDLDDPAEAVRVGWRIVSAFRAPFRIDDRDLYTTATVGVAIATEGTGPDDLVREADTAMYVAKSDGRDRVAVFNQDLAVAVTARLELEGQLRGALAAGQFELWYQPEVDLRTGTVRAVEALLRWRRADGELLTADQFIEVAEEAGLIIDIGRWVLHQACADGARWRSMRPGSPLVVRANVSAHQLAGSDLLRALDEALGRSDLDPSLLCVEVTETALLRKTAVVDDNFAGIRARSVRIALDDFGTGYASLAYLRDHAVDVVKIDRSFVAGVASSEQSRRLVSGILAFAASLDIDVTAEGIETDEQAAFLREAGCPAGQGFLFARAVPRAQIDGLLQSGFPVAVVP